MNILKFVQKQNASEQQWQIGINLLNETEYKPMNEELNRSIE